MNPTSKTRKPIGDLTLADLKAFPVWEYAEDEEGVDGQDETWVRPVPDPADYGPYFTWQVACEFTAAAGARFSGFVIVYGTMGKREVGGAVVLSGGDYFCISTKSSPRDLGVSSENLFPVTYELIPQLKHLEKVAKGVVTPSQW